MRHSRAGSIVIFAACSAALPAQIASPDPDVQRLVERVSIEEFKANVAGLTQWENRVVGSEGNRAAIDWIAEKLESFGYQVTRHQFTQRPRQRRRGRRGQGERPGQGTQPAIELENVWATKIGTTNPDRMYIISAHMDSVRRARGANDDASGSSLVIEAARAFAGADVQTGASVRFILWNAEETGLNGARAYVADREELQGVENPPGSGQYPEPRWLGIVQHDQILFDHGVPAETEQSPRADIDIEYQQASEQRAASIDLAAKLLVANAIYANEYAAEVNSNMGATDSVPFQDYCAAVSVRENQRRSEMPNGAAPHWHQVTDVYETYSEMDFLFGFATVKTTVSAIATLAGVRIDAR